MDSSGTNRQRSALTRAQFLKLAAASVTGLALGTQLGCSTTGPATVGAIPRRGGELVFARSQEPVSLNPLTVSDNGAILLLYNVFDTLVTVNADSTGVDPSLATRWTVSPDGLRYVFTLRSGVAFSDGTPMTAADVVYSLNRVSAAGAVYAFLFPDIAGITAEGDNTVEITLKRPYAPLIDNLSVFAAAIVPRAAVERDADAFAKAPIGTGPYRIESFVRGQQVVLTRNEHYWKSGRPYLDRITMPYVPEDTTRILKLRSNEAQLAELIPTSDVESLRQSNDVAVSIDPAFQLDSISFNYNSPLVANRDVRQALAHAIDVEGINASVYGGLGTVANSVSPRMRGWTPAVRPYTHDLAKARQLLAKAAVPAGTALPLLIDSGNAAAVATAQVIEQGWRAAGLNPMIEQLDFATLLQRAQAQDYVTVLAYETADVPSPWELLQLTFEPDSPTKGQFTSVANRQIADAVTAGTMLTDPVEQVKALNRIQQLGMDELPFLPINFPPTITGRRPSVHGFKAVGTGWWRLEDVWLDS